LQTGRFFRIIILLFYSLKIGRCCAIFGSLLNDPQGFLLQILYRLPAVLVALSFHEWGHAYAAYKLGDPTARNLGRMNVNPLSHIDFLGLLMMALAGFGWAKPVPINPRNFKHYRRDDIIVSVAGVTVNFLLAIFGMLLIYLFAIANGSNIIIANILYAFVSINLSLMVFNLLPIPPLDGSHLLEDLLIKVTGPKPFVFLSRYGSYILLILLVTGIVTSVLGAVVSFILNGLITLFDGVFRFPGFYYLLFAMEGMAL